jgi:hypothetical protein
MEQTKSESPQRPSHHRSHHSALKNSPPRKEKALKSSRVGFGTASSQEKKEIPYFRDSRFRDRVQSSYQSIDDYSMMSGKADRQTDRISRMKNILQDISNQQDALQNKTQLLQHGKSREEDLDSSECTFTPQIRRNPRYHISSTLEDRNKSW